MMADVYIALGSNEGDRSAMLSDACRELATVVHGLRVSSIYETDPVGYAAQRRFLNAVVTGTTDLAPLQLLRSLQRIEALLGRERPFPNSPRTIDLDLLLYDSVVLDSPELTLPHPRLHERFFVLVPLVELAPDLRHPAFNCTASELLRSLGPVSGLERIDAGNPAPATAHCSRSPETTFS